MKNINKEELKCIAFDVGWELVFEKENNKLLRFKKGDDINVVIDIWWSTGTVAIQERTPKGYRAYKYIKNCGTKDFENILNEPFNPYRP